MNKMPLTQVVLLETCISPYIYSISKWGVIKKTDQKGQIGPGQNAPAHTKVPRVCASLRPGLPACPGAQTSLRFPMLKHDKKIAKPSRQ